MRDLHESFLMAMSAIAAHKLRSALTLLGILVGVFSIIIVMTAMRAMQHEIENEISSLGSQTFMVRKWPARFFTRPKGMEKIYRRKNIDMHLGERFKERAVLPQSIGLDTVFWAGQIETRFKKTAPDVQLFGETAGSFPARNWTVAEGRGISDADVDGNHDICVMGSALAKKVFPFGSPLGERLKVDGINYTVVGVLEPRGASLGGEEDNFAIIPLTTGLNRYGGQSWRSLTLLVQAPDQAHFEACVEEARGILRVLRKVPPGEDDDFEILSNDTLINQFNTVTFAVRASVVVISGISLLAAGIGIMNIMLVSVTERTREIGIRRAIGAKKRNIMMQFIMEAIVLCEVGGVMGVVLGIIGGDTAAWYLKLTPVIPVGSIILGLGACSLVGLIFGTYPAFKAANLDPIESLRYE